MARYRESASESESKPFGGRVSAKAKNATAAQQAQQEYLSKHINSNGPKDIEKPHPLDFESYPSQALTNYSRKYNLGSESPSTINGYMLKSSIGKKTSSYKKHTKKVPTRELAATVKKHFINLPSRENEIITNFLYKVKNQEKDFKLSFK
ncbi:hypothetical protein CAAN1_16S01002 [[Candida] anglica]|uniref:Histone deacetylase complex subunit SAP30 Sin3 binding domain-containing protein n=1 Tax=[Candida] anglica TaxID=148631 RepID=A0ABP0EAB2_9ASCO